MQTAFFMLINMEWSGSLGLGAIVSGMLTIVWAMLLDRFMQNNISMTKTRERSHSHYIPAFACRAFQGASQPLW